MLRRCRHLMPPLSCGIKTSPSTLRQSFSTNETNTFDSHRRLLTRIEEQQSVNESDTDSLRRKTAYVAETVSDDDSLVTELFSGIKDGNRAALARSITLIENIHPLKQAKAQLLLSKVMEFSRQKLKHSINRVPSFRIG